MPFFPPQLYVRVPRLERRLDFSQFRESFPEVVTSLLNNMEPVIMASIEIRTSTKFKQLMEV
jgi:hypothetical protein